MRPLSSSLFLHELYKRRPLFAPTSISASLCLSRERGMPVTTAVMPPAKDGLILVAGITLKLCLDDGSFVGTTWETVIQTARAHDLLSQNYKPEEVRQHTPCCRRARRVTRAMLTLPFLAVAMSCCCWLAALRKVLREVLQEGYCQRPRAVRCSTTCLPCASMVMLGLTCMCTLLCRYAKRSLRAAHKAAGTNVLQMAEYAAVKKRFAFNLMQQVVRRFVLCVLGSKLHKDNEAVSSYGQAIASFEEADTFLKEVCNLAALPAPLHLPGRVCVETARPLLLGRTRTRTRAARVPPPAHPSQRTRCAVAASLSPTWLCAHAISRPGST